ncbi:L,D-transpeptidase [Rhizobium sp. RM]|uniref:L,D-transpeptidase n=1 Tax=Rhizobium sp. RM TaxID=2748079 RepID=UPI00110ED896|nr:L,D-transpeptidase [Rhizobium sp. RM]NWJ25129.1 L,D-transpeptidase [Rhizobium sp. RM]TMV16895.1 L,D-transpeptidase [Rhizobium sp. Td3]
MASLISKTCRRTVSVAGLMLLPLLSGCLFVTDTTRMDPDVFVRETAPVFGFNSVGSNRKPELPPQPGQLSTRPPDLFRTRFHQEYGPPVQGRGLNYVPPARGQAPVADQTVTYGLPVSNPLHRVIYNSIRDDDRTLPAIPYSRIDPRYLRQEVTYQTAEVPGTIVVDTKQHYLYLVQSGGKAIRYGVGLGRDGYAWSGRGKIQWKAKWPRWTPPDDMVKRQPELASISAANGGMTPGLNNPLGARALYIFKDGKDTLYRVHGTPDWQSVGKATSSGCVRMLNQDVIDLYERVPQGAQIVVI